MFNNHLFERRIKMMLQIEEATISASSTGFSICCRVRDLSNIFKELYKSIPKDTKITDLKKLLVRRLH